MTLIFHDWEFLEDGETIKPISCGFVSEYGDEFYAVFEDGMELANKSDWLKANVLLHLNESDILSPYQIKMNIESFIKSLHSPELWAWYGAYDHVALAQTLGGPMINLPDGIPMFTNDIKTLELFAGQRNLERLRRLNADKPAQSVLTEHHALEDAKHDRDLYNFFWDHF